MSAVTTVSVDLQPTTAARGYDILIGGGLLAGAGAKIAKIIEDAPVVIVTDTNVAALYLDRLETALGGAGISHSAITVPAGEQTKSFAGLETLCGQLLDRNIERRSTLIALGGGVVGDLTGFAASIALRGIGFVQIPTSLLAQVDSSVGGKTGIDTSQGKNLVGSFYQPRLVLADTDVLDSLPRRELLAGYAEVVKYGLLGDAGFFAWLEDHGEGALAGDAAGRAHMIERCCVMKAAIVARDEREAGERALLNLGHTFGHAFEVEAGYGGGLLHGEAVAVGICLAFALSVRLGLCAAADLDRLRTHFAVMGLPVKPADLPPPPGQRGWDVARLTGAMQHDKKVRRGKPKFVLARAIGDAFLSDDIDMDAVAAVLGEALSG